MGKRGSALENGISLLAIIVLLVFAGFYISNLSSFSFTGFAVFFSGNQSDFSAGTYNNTEWQGNHITFRSGIT